MANASEMETAHNVGLFDAHCHPTDIVSAVDRISNMRAKVLTIMATRAQDQELVMETAKRYPITSRDDLESERSRHVVPSFGWHPWFAHQMVDDRDDKSKMSVDKKEHFLKVLTPSPDDEEFLESLPDPLSLSDYLDATEVKLRQFPLALVGEIGLDRAFRVPYGPFKSPDDPETAKPNMSNKTGNSDEEREYTPGSREGRPLTQYRVSMEHQKTIFKAQLQLAAKLRRPVSIHSVATHGVAFDVFSELWKGHEKPSKSALKKQKKDAANAVHADDAIDKDETPAKDQPLPHPERICMHSYSGPADSLKQFLGPRVPADIFFSFSELINFGSHQSEKAIEVVKAVPDDKILIESDLHCAGDKMDELLESIFERVCHLKGWKIEDGAKQLRANWERFVFGPI